jgi:hypothetical protein
MSSPAAGGVWSQQAYLKASNAEANDRFGGSVAVSGDALVVGGDGEDSSASGGEGDNSAGQAGAAYVWQLPAQAGVTGFVGLA